jgi:hypothetical protein
MFQKIYPNNCSVVGARMWDKLKWQVLNPGLASENPLRIVFDTFSFR